MEDRQDSGPDLSWFNVRLPNTSSSLALFVPNQITIHTSETESLSALWLLLNILSIMLIVNLFKFLDDRLFRLLITTPSFLWDCTSHRLRPSQGLFSLLEKPLTIATAFMPCSWVPAHTHVCSSACEVLDSHWQTGDLVVILQCSTEMFTPVWSLSVSTLGTHNFFRRPLDMHLLDNLSEFYIMNFIYM